MSTDDVSIRGEESKPEALQEYVFRQISRGIVSGELAAGQRLSPAAIAAEFEVSHIPVREALSALQAIGQVEHRPRVGFFVTELSLEDVEDTYHWRAVLEREAHAKAVPLLSEDDIARMEIANLEGIRAAKAENETSFIQHNREFHFIPFTKVGSDILLRFLEQLWDRTARYYSMIRGDVSKDALLTHHDDLLEAFKARDVDRVNSAMDKHRQVTLNAMKSIRDAGDGSSA